MINQTKLERALPFSVITLYGLGTVVGAGIYVLIGKVVSQAGIYAPISFLIAGFVALFTAFSYAKLSAKFPKCSGASIYIHKAWHKEIFTSLIGWAVIFTGIVSSSTMTHGFVGYIKVFFNMSEPILIIGFIIILSLIAIWGIKQSAILITIITLIELGGLLFIIFISDMKGNILWDDVMSLNKAILPGIMLGSFLAFYAFIGFEDMVNMVEEVKNPSRNVPLAIITVIIVTSILYVLISFIAINAMPIDKLSISKSPIADIVSSKGYSPHIISIISLIAIINGALVQVIMVSRMMYGMARQRVAPEILATINPITRTPIIATILSAILMLIFALWFPLITLAKITSFVMLLIYMMVNISFVKISLQERSLVNTIIPTIGALLCATMVMLEVIY